MNESNIIVYYHNKDMDGYTSGAILKYKYPKAELIGWDYVDEVPDSEMLRNKEVILIDITFPIKDLTKNRESRFQINNN